ncbi:hypothetical protein EZS27_012711 [termite gut metagenome]|uniref:Uncharacterized protein n=1 Tax=termite gut metagenome TaxID=433724 RepID=A0A5J4S2A5_9ZZZZ
MLRYSVFSSVAVVGVGMAVVGVGKFIFCIFV